MKMKRKILYIILAIVFATIILFQTVTQAATPTTPLYLGVNELRTRVEPNMGYGIADPNFGGAKIWNFLKYTSSTSNITSPIAAYCLKAGVGFSDVKRRETYNVYYDMLKERTQIAAQNAVLNGIVNGGQYNEILASLDMMYVPGESTEADKATLLEAAGIHPEEIDFPMTEDDIEATQQAALWYFTNKEDPTYDKTDDMNWLFYTLDANTYTSLSDYKKDSKEGEDRQQQAEKLYKYMITTAKANASKYETQNGIGQPVKVDTTALSYEQTGSNYIIGPIHMTKNNDLPYTLDFTLKNGGTDITNFKLLDKDKNEVSTKNPKDLVGNNFYISTPVAGITTVNVGFNIKYNSTAMTLWASTTNNQAQPVVVVQKKQEEVPTNLTITPKEKQFDLALRKYITKVNDVDVVNTRAPSIDLSSLTSGTTATYKHRKDPITVKTDDLVTYNITVYNEGDKVGRATKIVDQLPTGLEFQEIVSGDYALDNYDKTTNKLSLNKKGTTNIEAYTTGNLKSETVTIKCKVTQAQGTTDSKVLTNVAWIAEEYDAVLDKTITNQVGADRDSEPMTTPKVDKDNMADYKGNTANKAVTPADSAYFYKGEQDDDDFEKLIIKPDTKQFDLALRKYITKVNDKDVADTRIPAIDETTLIDGTTATYKHRKDPLAVKTDDLVTYNITVYNEGEKAGRATKIVDQLPTGLEFQEIVSGDYALDNYDKTTNKLSLNKKGTTNIEAYTTGNLKSETVTIKCKVIGSVSSTEAKILTNVAWISEEFNAVDNITITNQVGADRDSEPMTTPKVDKDNMEDYKGNTANKAVTPADPAYFYKGEQDDDDFEKLIIKAQPFDLKFVKRITEVNKQTVKDRIEDVNVSKLNVDGSSATTAEFKLNKTPVAVRTGDLVKYTFRAYNEGYMDGYASQITEDIPEGLEFLWSPKEGTELKEDETITPEEKEAIEFNQKMYWTYDKELKTISTDYLSKEKELTPGSNLIKAFGENDGTKTVADLKYKEVSVIFKVTSEVSEKIIRNEACISGNTDQYGNDIKDRDSDPHKWVKYEDDEDYDNIIVQSFDLSLRKFIIAVSHNDTVADTDYLKNEDGTYTRAPVVDTSKLNTKGQDGKTVTTATYNHTKTPVELTAADTVVYMLRVYNEGEIDGYAAEIKDHLPPYLKFIDNEFNKKYGWTASTDGRTLTTKYLDNTKVAKATKGEDGKTVLSYKEVPVMCKVNNDVQSNYKLTNIAEISKYLDENKQTINDRDSKENNVVVPSDQNFPTYKDNEKGEYIPGQEDDDDFEKVIVKIFDLALRKWVTQAIVIEDGTQNVTETGHTPYDDPEEIVKTELHRKKLNTTVVKFKFGVRIINEGDIAGYAKLIKDYIPDGLEMIESENPDWKNEGNGVVSTRALENKLLQPGEVADVFITLTWINNENNIGIFTNIAEIAEDYNDKHIPDIDSIPDNFKDGEDDIDEASVMVSIETGQARIYFTLGTIILITIAGGVVLIKKYVL